MKADKKKIYTIELLLIAILSACAFFISSSTKYILAGIVLVCALLIPLLLKKKNIAYATKNKVKKTLIIFALLYLAMFYTLGIYTGFYKSNIGFNIKNIFLYILPITITIIGTEIIRNKLLLLKTRTSYILVTIITVAIDILLQINVYNLKDFTDITSVAGFIVFSSLSTNLLYNYLTTRYDKDSIIIYRLITTLYVYIIPIIPDVYVYFRTLIRMFFPLVIYDHIDNRYNPEKEMELTKDIKKQNIALATTFVLLTLFICLVSCKFSYGALVIGSGSMTGTMDKGDVVVFKNKEEIKEGDVIVFMKKNIKIVHRVIKINKKNNKTIYFTKGDANLTKDQGYISDKEIVGKVLFRIRYIGKPTLWLREQFS